MGESRDANDPRDTMRGMRKEAEAEFEREQQGDTGGQEHASREDREGRPASRRPVEAATRDQTRATRQGDDSAAQRVPRGGAATGGGSTAARGEPAEPSSVEEPEKP
jgi:hypothetical protein